MIRVTRSIRRSSLCHPVPASADRQGEDAPAVRSLIDRVTALLSGITGSATTAKPRGEFDVRNPFIPSLSPVCRLVDTALLFCVVLISLAAAGAALIAQVM